MSSHPGNIGSYQILSLLGVGGMGKVYLARERSGRQVALKVLLPELTAATLDRLRFEREFDIASRLDHPCLVKVYDRFFEDNLCYYSMEYVQGVDLFRRFQLAPGQQTSRQVSREALDLFAQLAGALAYLHRHNVIHRDLKSENVLVGAQQQLRLLDFGLACFHRLASKANRITSPGMVLGTPYAMAPEQILGDGADVKSDLYSLGVMLFQIFCQKLPFDAPDPMAVLYQILHQPTPPFQPALPAPEGLGELINSLLSKEPHLRPRDGDEVEQQLRYLLEHWESPVVAPRPEPLLAPEPVQRLVSPRFIGRRFQQAWFEQRLQHLLEGRGAWGLVAGPSGAGKSYLLQQWAAQAKSHGVTAVRVQPVAGSHIPYQLWTPVLRWAIHDRPLSPALQPFLPSLSLLLPELSQGPIRFASDDPLQRYHLFEGMARLIGDRCQQPAVLLIDQLHEADPASLEFLHYWLETRYYSAEALHLPLLVLACNDEEPLQGEVETLRRLAAQQPCGSDIALTGFSLEETRQFLESLLDQQIVHAETVKFLHQETEGKPLYLQELARLGIEGGAWQWKGGVWSFRPSSTGGSLSSGVMRLPARLQQALKHRLDGLDADSLAVLQWAAVLGPLLEFHHLQAVCSLPDRVLYEICADLSQRRLLCETQDFQMASLGTTEVVLDSMPWSLRRQRHAHVAAYLEGLLNASQWDIGYHWSQAGEPEKSGRAFLAAAQQAIRSYAFDEACRCLDQIEQMAPQTHPLSPADFQEIWSDALLGAGHPQQAAQRLEKLLQQPDQDPLEHIRRMRKLGTACEVAGQLARAYEIQQQALQQLSRLKTSGAVENERWAEEGNRICEQQSRVLFMLRPAGWLQDFVQLLRAQARVALKSSNKKSGQGGQETWAQAFLYGGFLSLRRLNWSGGARLSIRGALERLDRLPDSASKGQMLGDTGYLLHLSGSTHKARRVLEQGRDVLLKLGAVNGLARAYLQLNAVSFFEGRIGHSLHYGQLALQHACRVNNRFEEAIALATCARAAALLGDLGSAEQHLQAVEPLRQLFRTSYLDLVVQLAIHYYYWGSARWSDLASHSQRYYEQCKRDKELPYHSLHFGLMGLEARLEMDRAEGKLSSDTEKLLSELATASRGQKLFRPIFKRLEALSWKLKGKPAKAFDILGECCRRAEAADIPFERYRCHSWLAEWLADDGLGEHHRIEAEKAYQAYRAAPDSST